MAPPADPYEIEVVNQPPPTLNDAYHRLLVAPWWVDFAAIGLAFLLSNVVFAALFDMLGGVANAHTTRDYFYFSVQTMGTIGYGVMYPQTDAANVLVVVEAIFGIILVALSTGLVFAKFSVPRGRMRFAPKLTISPIDGVPTLMLRSGNLRSNRIVEARIHLALVRTEKTSEGIVLYRLYDLELVRDMTPLFTRAWTVMHTISGKSPLVGATPESLARDEIEFIVTLTGLDETSSQTVHGRTSYVAADVVWGARHKDMLTDVSSTKMQLDLKYFDDVMPTQRTAEFPYP
jgi:inward rectifier potassium channel